MTRKNEENAMQGNNVRRGALQNRPRKGWFSLCDDGTYVCWDCLTPAERDERHELIKSYGECVECGKVVEA